MVVIYCAKLAELHSRVPNLEELAQIGFFLGGLSALIGVIWAGTAWSQHQKMKRSQAAALVFSKVRRCIFEITEIGLQRGGFQYLSFKQPIRSETAEKPCPELPPKLIANKIDLLKREVDEGVVTISGTTAKDFFCCLSDLEKYSWGLCASVHADLQENEVLKKLPHTREVLDEFPDKLNQILVRVEAILTPIIESGE